MRWWNSFRTAFELAEKVNELCEVVQLLEREWINKRDALDRLQRQLALRERRSIGGGDGDLDQSRVAPTTDLPHPADISKAALRRFARERGMIR